MTTVACIQMASGPNVGANLLEAERLIGMAVDKGAKPDCVTGKFCHHGQGGKTTRWRYAKPMTAAPCRISCPSRPVKQGIWLVGGTVPMVAKADNKIRAASLLYNDQGKQAARYDKIHLFDVSLVR